MPDAVSKPKIALMQSSIPHYRVPVTKALVANPEADVSVVTTPGGDWVTAKQVRSFEGIPNLTVLPVRLIRLPGLTLIFYRGLRRLLREQAIDVLIAEPRMGLLTIIGLALWPVRKNGRRVPIVWWMAGWRNKERASWIVRLADWAEWSIVRRGGAAACYGSRAASRAVDLGIPESATLVAQNSIDTSALEQAVARRRDDDPKTRRTGPLRILFVGWILDRKRLDLVLEAMASGGAACREAVFRIVGRGPDIPRLRQIAERAGIDSRIEWVDETTDPDALAAHLVWADVGILPCAGGLMLNTCMAAGLPVICGEADGTEVDLVVHQKTGWLFEGQDWKTVAELLEDAGRSRERLAAMGASAFEHLKRTATVDRVVEALVKACRIALSREAARPR